MALKNPFETPRLFFGKVMHKRFFPKENLFSYGIYYLSLPILTKDKKEAHEFISNKKLSAISFCASDHGALKGNDLHGWASSILQNYGLQKDITQINLITMPRVWGYVFNPVSFWLCFNDKQEVLAIICEVHNTFGEQHSYLCKTADLSPIRKDTIIKTEKLFHVSPFLQREGYYEFHFDIDEGHFVAIIDYFNGEGKKQLATSLKGHFAELNQANLNMAKWRYPMVTIKAIGLIHWQALKLFIKGMKYIPRPKQLKSRFSTSESVKKQ